MEKSPLLNCATSHGSIHEFRGLLSKKTFKEAFKFAFVRNPWDRYVSAFRAGRAGIGTNDLPFEVRDYAVEPQSAIHFEPQYKFICDDDGRVLVDFVGRYEQLEEDWAKVCEIGGCPCSLSHERNTERRPYQEYYSAEQREELRKLYAKDIELFGYEFGGTE